MWFIQLSRECVCDHVEIKSSCVCKGDCLLTCRDTCTAENLWWILWAQMNVGQLMEATSQVAAKNRVKSTRCFGDLKEVFFH